jgi:hypothetical protein
MTAAALTPRQTLYHFCSQTELLKRLERQYEQNTDLHAIPKKALEDIAEGFASGEFSGSELRMGAMGKLMGAGLTQRVDQLVDPLSDALINCSDERVEAAAARVLLPYAFPPQDKLSPDLEKNLPGVDWFKDQELFAEIVNSFSNKKGPGALIEQIITKCVDKPHLSREDYLELTKSLLRHHFERYRVSSQATAAAPAAPDHKSDSKKS